MDRSHEILLIKETREKDEYGIERPVRTSRRVFCDVQSVSRSEFFDGGRNGLNPEYQMTMFFADYDGERIVEYKGQRYGVYRTYHARTDELELYVERKGGLNGGN